MTSTQAIIIICIAGVLAADNVGSLHAQNFQSQNTLQEFSIKKLPLSSLLTGGSHFNVTHNDTVCMMFDGDFTLSITYLNENAKTDVAQLRIPKASDDGIKVDGSCTAKEGQWIEILWGNHFPRSSFRFSFNVTEDGQSWFLLEVNAVITLDDENFINATYSGEALSSVFYPALDPADMPFNRSYKCFSNVSHINATTYMDNEFYPLPIYLSMENVQIQAYNEKVFFSEFTLAKYCQLDRSKDLLPMFVGCTIIIIVSSILLVHYCCPHNRRHGYERI